MRGPLQGPPQGHSSLVRTLDFAAPAVAAAGVLDQLLEPLQLGDEVHLDHEVGELLEPGPLVVTLRENA